MDIEIETLADGTTYCFETEDGHPCSETVIEYDGPVVDMWR